jgi:hypothetical protein
MVPKHDAELDDLRQAILAELLVAALTCADDVKVMRRLATLPGVTRVVVHSDEDTQHVTVDVVRKPDLREMRVVLVI